MRPGGDPAGPVAGGVRGSGEAAAVAPFLTAANGWKALAAAVVVYEAICVEEELLSRGFDRLLERHPVFPRLVVLIVAFHLINWIPERVDPFRAAVHVTRIGGRNERLKAWGKRALRRRKAARKSSA